MACIFGNIMEIDTTGASEITANQNNLTITGVEASIKLAEHDLTLMEKYKDIITKVAKAKKMDPALLAAIISKESRAGAVLKNGWGDQGNGFGLMQIDKRYHTPVGAWDSEKHLTQATEILTDYCQAVRAKFRQWSPEQQLKGGISAYNAGVKNIRSYELMDLGTTGDDYANDVVARAQWFKSKGY